MKPKILALYYSQTGQLRNILDSIVTDLKDKAEIDFVQIEPVTPFPFPWSPQVFFDAMPETVQHIPAPVKRLPEEVMNKDYDLIIFGYQPWFLNPSQPITAFLQGEDAKIFNNKPVVTLIGARNMWLNAQEKVKSYLKAQNARLVGNIALVDSNPNLVSTLTVIRWAFKGQKEKSGMLPEAGVQQREIQHARVFGTPIYKTIVEDNLMDLHRQLLALGCLALKPGLVLLEQKGIKNFRYWSKFIREKGGPGDPNRAKRVKMFQNLLTVAIFVLSPITSVSAFIKLQIKKRSLLKDVEYFKQLKYEEGRI